jgi:hypothetical protein
MRPMSHWANSRHAEERAPICLSNIRNKKLGILPGTFILDQALVILIGRSLIIAAPTSLESDWQCDSLGPV